MAKNFTLFLQGRLPEQTEIKNIKQEFFTLINSKEEYFENLNVLDVLEEYKIKMDSIYKKAKKFYASLEEKYKKE